MDLQIGVGPWKRVTRQTCSHRIGKLERAVREGLVIRAYLKAEISLGELGELVGMG